MSETFDYTAFPPEHLHEVAGHFELASQRTQDLIMTLNSHAQAMAEEMETALRYSPEEVRHLSARWQTSTLSLSEAMQGVARYLRELAAGAEQMDRTT